MDFVPDANDDIWAQKILQQIKEQKKNIYSFAPWLLFADVPAKFEHLIPEIPDIPTLKQIALTEQFLLRKIISNYVNDNTAEEKEGLQKFKDVIP